METEDVIALEKAYHLNTSTVVLLEDGWGHLNEAWLVSSMGQRFVLKHHRFAAPLRVETACQFSVHLRRCGIPSIEFLANRQGQYVTVLAGRRVFTMARYIDGQPYSQSILPASPDTLTEMAYLLGRLHEAAKTYSGTKFKHEFINSTKTINLLNNIGAALSEVAESEFERQALEVLGKKIRHLRRDPYHESMFDGCTHLMIHGDFHPSNILFDSSGQVRGIIDFEFSCYQLRIWDLIWSIAASCRMYAGEILLTPIDLDGAALFLKSYHQASPLTKAELEGIPKLAVAASNHACYYLEQLYVKHRHPTHLMPVRDPSDWFWWQDNESRMRRICESFSPSD